MRLERLVTYADWRLWAAAAETYTMLPYAAAVDWYEGPVPTWEEAWRDASPESFVLESGKGGRYTFLGLHPVSVIRGTNEYADIWTKGAGESIERAGGGERHWSRTYGPPLQTVKQWMQPYRSPKVPGAPKFLGGCVGFWGYDVARSLERLPVRAKPDLAVPDFAFALYDRVWILDRERSKFIVAVHTRHDAELAADPAVLEAGFAAAEREAHAMLDRWHAIAQSAAGRKRRSQRERLMQQSTGPGGPLAIDVESMPDIDRSFRKDEFEDAVTQIQAYIGQGDVFQVNLSVRQSRPLRSTPEAVYEWLRLVNPSPYMGLLRFDGFALASASPELLVQLESGTLRTRPIAGTRPRGATPAEDRRLADELLANEKERAEHVMLVDLERNDLGRISAFGSVRVSELMAIEYYSHVMHIVSEVESRLAEGKDAFDAIGATFPGGTITGAPKVRTMEIIEELEPVRRGSYTGSIGWIDYNGDMEFNIVIRTLTCCDGIGYVQAGAGIVIDSDPSREYTESLNKAKAVWKAIEFSERMMSGD